MDELKNIVSFDKKQKNNQIQVLRVLFCFAIVFYHYTYRYFEIYGVSNIFANSLTRYLSYFGLFSFFILTGFYLRRRDGLLSKTEALLYWLKRFLSIYAVYAISVIIIYLFSITGLFGEERTVSFGTFLQNLLFINIFTGGGYVDGSHWYVFAILCLYLLAFVIEVLPKFFSSFQYLVWIALLFLSLFSLVAIKYLNSDTMVIKMLKGINLFLCQGYFPYVFIGLSLSFFDHKNIICFKNLALLICFFIVCVYAALSDWVYLLILLLSIVLICLAIFNKLVFLNNARPLILIGNASYCIYLIHQNIGYLLINLFNNIMNYYFSFSIAIFIIFAAGVAMHVFVEKNLKKLISHIGNNNRTTSGGIRQ